MPTSEQLRRREVVARFVDAAVSGDRQGYFAGADALDWPEAWPDFFREIVAIGHVDWSTQNTFANQWAGNPGTFVRYPPGGRQLRQIFKDDIELLVAAISILAPKFIGNPPEVIYRGQSVREYEKGIVGFSWTENVLLAESYARHELMNNEPCVVLMKFFPEKAIIGCISRSELLVNPMQVKDAKIIYEAKEKWTSRDYARPGLSIYDLRHLYNVLPSKSQRL